MNHPDEIVSRVQAVRVRYLDAVIRWRAAREDADAKLREAEHELAQGLAELFRRPKNVTQLRAG